MLFYKHLNNQYVLHCNRLCGQERLASKNDIFTCMQPQISTLKFDLRQTLKNVLSHIGTIIYKAKQIGWPHFYLCVSIALVCVLASMFCNFFAVIFYSELKMQAQLGSLHTNVQYFTNKDQLVQTHKQKRPKEGETQQKLIHLRTERIVTAQNNTGNSTWQR